MKSQNTPRANGEEDTEALIAACSFNRSSLSSYLEPILPIMHGGRTMNHVHEIEDRAIQSVIARQENRLALCSLLLTRWYPYRYRIVAIEELNAVAAGRNSTARTLEDLARAFDYFVIDLSHVDGQRARSGFGMYDDIALLRFVESNLEYEGCKVIVAMDRRIRVVERAYPKFCKFAREKSIMVFDQGKYMCLGGWE